MKKFAVISLLLFLISSTFSLDRRIRCGVSGANCLRLYGEASVQGYGNRSELMEFHQRYALGAYSIFREYRDDNLGLYNSTAIYGDLGSLDIIRGFLSLSFSAGAHLSRIEDGYNCSELLIGGATHFDFTFWKDRSIVYSDFHFLWASNFLVGWGTLSFSPLENVEIGCGLHYDGELDNWGNDLPFLEDKWNRGINYFALLGYNFDL